jgi:hypothetical protein
MITFQRTGTLVRKDGHWYVLTAARNVYNQAISNYYERLELYFIKK